MKHPDFDKAFAPTPEIVSLSIEDAFRKGKKAMKMRHKITAMLSAAAVLVIAFAVIGLALPSEPQPDVVSQPKLNEPAGEPTVYYTSKGVYYHNIEDCSGMLGAQPHPLSEAQSDGKIACPVCVLGERETWFDNEAETWFDNEAEPMPTPELYGGSVVLDGNGAVLQAESRPVPATAEPTPLPIPATDASPTEAPVSEQLNAEEQIVYHTEQGKYYHTNMHCSGMMNAKAHSLTEALRAGKEPCPVCYIPELPVDSEPQPADHMCVIGMEYFLEVFDRGVMETFPKFDMQGSGKHIGDYMREEATYTNDDGLYLAVYREMNNDALMSGRIALMFPEEFDHDLFSSEGAQWYRNTYALAMETFVSMPVNSGINMPTDALKQIYVWFDGEIKPDVCEMEFETEGGFFTMSFDINGDEPSFATMNYNVSRA